MANKLALATILTSQRNSDFLETTLTLDWVPYPPMVPASLYGPENNKVKVLDLHKLIGRKQSAFIFETYDQRAIPLKVSALYNFISWWRPDQLALAQDTSRVWLKQSFTPSDMVVAEIGGGKIGWKRAAGETGPVIPNGWDHHHCFLCWESISNIEGFVHDGYTDGKEWICESCYSTYIESGFGKKLGG